MMNAPADKTSINQQTLSQKQQELGDRFLRRSLVDAQHILGSLQVNAVSSDSPAMAELLSLAHRLVGTSATLGFHDLSDLARELETQLGVADSDARLLQDSAARVLDQITRLARDRAIA